MDRFTDCRLLLQGRVYNILGVTTDRNANGLVLVLHTAGGANPMIVLDKDVDRETLIAALDLAAPPGETP